MTTNSTVMNVPKDPYIAVQIGIVRHRPSPKIVIFIGFSVLVIADQNVDAWFGRDPVKRLVIKRPAWPGNHADQPKTCHHTQDVDAERPPNAPRGCSTQHQCCASQRVVSAEIPSDHVSSPVSQGAQRRAIARAYLVDSQTFVVNRANALEPLLALLGLKQPWFFTRRFAELPQQIDTGPAVDQISQLAQGMVLREVSVNDGPHVCTDDSARHGNYAHLADH